MSKPVKKGKKIISKILDSVTYLVKKFGQIMGGGVGTLFLLNFHSSIIDLQCCTSFRDLI